MTARVASACRRLGRGPDQAASVECRRPIAWRPRAAPVQDLPACRNAPAPVAPGQSAVGTVATVRGRSPATSPRRSPVHAAEIRGAWTARVSTSAPPPLPSARRGRYAQGATRSTWTHYGPPLAGAFLAASDRHEQMCGSSRVLFPSRTPSASSYPQIYPYHEVIIETVRYCIGNDA